MHKIISRKRLTAILATLMVAFIATAHQPAIAQTSSQQQTPSQEPASPRQQASPQQQTSSQQQTPSQKTPDLLPIPVGPDAYLSWDRWPLQRIGARAYMRSTYDRKGGNESADASHFLFMGPEDHNVTLDVKGQGVLYFVRTNHWHGSPWHYTVDGKDNRVEETGTSDPVHAAAIFQNTAFIPAAAFPPPLNWTWGATKGADLVWTPIAFRKSLQLAYSRTRYGTGYYIYDLYADESRLSRPIRTWNSGQAPEKEILELVGRAGTDIAPRNIQTDTGSLTLDRETLVLAEIKTSAHSSSSTSPSMRPSSPFSQSSSAYPSLSLPPSPSSSGSLSSSAPPSSSMPGSPPSSLPSSATPALLVSASGPSAPSSAAPSSSMPPSAFPSSSSSSPSSPASASSLPSSSLSSFPSASSPSLASPSSSQSPLASSPAPSSPSSSQSPSSYSLSSPAASPSPPSTPFRLRALKLTLPLDNAQALERVRLKITWDGLPYPSIDAPLCLFFGAGTFYNRENREFLVKGFPINIRFDEPANTMELSCYYPMPFFTSASISLEGIPLGNEKIQKQKIRYELRYEPDSIPIDQSAYFHATYRDIPVPQPGLDMQLLDTKGIEGQETWSGNFAGMSFIFSHDGNLNTLEGDPRFFFDDSRTPQAYGTGTEEWAGGGDYWGGQNMTLPFAGHPVGAREKGQAKNEKDLVQSAYRFLLADLMPFGRRAVIRLEHGGENLSTEHYESVVYWYGLPAPSLIPTDDLDIGATASEQAHAYRSPGASAVDTVLSRYEEGIDTFPEKPWGLDPARLAGYDNRKGTEIYPAHPEDGRHTRGISEFTMRLAPGSLGALLRRTLDYSFPNQQAAVYIADASTAFPPEDQDEPAAPPPPGDHWKPAAAPSPQGGHRKPAGPSPKENHKKPAALPPPGGDHWELAGTWWLAGSNTCVYSDADGELGRRRYIVQTSDRRFRDDEFLIPARLTAHRTAIKIRIKPIPVNTPLYPGHPFPKPGAWSALRYSLYSFVLPDYRLRPYHPRP